MGVFDIFRKKGPALDPAVLRRIAELALERDLRVVVELLSFLPPSSSPYGPAAALSVKALVEAASPEDIAAFDQWYREPTYSGVRSLARPTWEAMHLGSLDEWVRQYPATVAIATFHRSGFVRQKAVELLATSGDGTELPFLLMRINDWVANVRAAAQAGVRRSLTVEYAARWVSCLAVLERVRLGGRGDHAWLLTAVDALVRRVEARPALEEGLVRGTRGVRRACVRIAAGLPDSTRLLSLALRDGDPLTSARAAEVLCRVLEGDALREVLAAMQQGNAGVRLLALETLCDRFPEEAELSLRAGFLDPATGVRELARFRWQKLGLPHVDFRAFYRNALEMRTGDRFITALRGLAEMGTVDDVPVFLEYVHDPRSRAREAAVLGIGRCDGAKQVEALVASLSDSSARVARAGRRYAKLYLGRGAVPKVARKSRGGTTRGPRARSRRRPPEPEG